MQKSVFKIILILYLITSFLCFVKTELVELVEENNELNNEESGNTENETNNTISDKNPNLPDELIIKDEFKIKNDDDIDIGDDGNLNNKNDTIELVEVNTEISTEIEDKDKTNKERGKLADSVIEHGKLTDSVIEHTKTIEKESEITNPVNDNIEQTTTQTSNKGITMSNKENKIAPVNSFNTNDDTNNYIDNSGELNVDNSNANDINENEGTGLFVNTNINNKSNSSGLFIENIGTIIIFVGAVSVGLVAISGYQVYKRKNEKGLKSQEYFISSLTQTTSTPSIIYENGNKPKITLDQSFIFDAEAHNQAYDMYNSAKQL